MSKRMESKLEPQIVMYLDLLETEFTFWSISHLTLNISLLNISLRSTNERKLVFNNMLISEFYC